MKFTPEIVAALQTLKDAAENDFERHRLSVLEKDLSNPPQVEIIDDKHQKFNDIVFYQCKDGHYIKNVYLHRLVWQYCCGDMPSPNEYDIHHKDWNPDNNSPDNLQKLTRGEHHAIHALKKGMYKRIAKKCAVCGTEFLAKSINNVYCSRDCYIKAKEGKEKICLVCGRTFVPSQSSVECCSKSCAAKLRCQNTDNEEKICPICGEKFIPEIKKTRYCSQECYKKSQQKKCTCIICGKEFINKSHAEVLCCSKECATKLGWQTRQLHKQ